MTGHGEGALSGAGLSVRPGTFCHIYVHRWRIGKSFAAFTTEVWLSYLACFVLTAMSPEPFGSLVSETLRKQLQKASDRMLIALREGQRARHHLRIVQDRLDELERRIAALRFDLSHRLRK
jgi:hypothetical protein